MLRPLKASAMRVMELDNKNWFLLVTEILWIMLDSMREHPGLADEAIKDARAEKKPPASH